MIVRIGEETDVFVNPSHITAVRVIQKANLYWTVGFDTVDGRTHLLTGNNEEWRDYEDAAYAAKLAMCNINKILCDERQNKRAQNCFFGFLKSFFKRKPDSTMSNAKATENKRILI